MKWGIQADMDWKNRQSSNRIARAGSPEALGYFLCPNGMPANFMISGGRFGRDRFRPLEYMLDSLIGQYPIIILHKPDSEIPELVLEAWSRMKDRLPVEDDNPLWIINAGCSEFEPFLGMADMQVIAACRQLAGQLGERVSPRFERVVSGHLEILHQLQVPVSLSGLFYLCRFWDMGEFHENVLSLPCGATCGSKIWADLGTDSEEFELFRAVIRNLANDAARSGWNADQHVGEINCLEAIRSNAVMLLPVSNLHAGLLIPYLAEELKANEGQQFLLLIDDVSMRSEQFCEYLCMPDHGCYVGILSENAADLFGKKDGAFERLAEKMDSFIIFKHSTGNTAIRLAEVMGNHAYRKAEMTKGTHRGFWNLLPNDSHDDVRYTEENRYRVMPEEILSLNEKQAIVFDTASNEIIFYN